MRRGAERSAIPEVPHSFWMRRGAEVNESKAAPLLDDTWGRRLKSRGKDFGKKNFKMKRDLLATFKKYF
jgi:hypothetical protein